MSDLGIDAITSVADVSMYVMTAEFGLVLIEKIECWMPADVVVLNKLRNEVLKIH